MSWSGKGPPGDSWIGTGGLTTYPDASKAHRSGLLEPTRLAPAKRKFFGLALQYRSLDVPTRGFPVEPGLRNRFRASRDVDSGRRAGRPIDHLRRSPTPPTTLFRFERPTSEPMMVMRSSGSLQVHLRYTSGHETARLPPLCDWKYTPGSLAVHKQGRSMPEIPVAIIGKGIRKPSAFAAMRSGPL